LGTDSYEEPKIVSLFYIASRKRDLKKEMPMQSSHKIATQFYRTRLRRLKEVNFYALIKSLCDFIERGSSAYGRLRRFKEGNCYIAGLTYISPPALLEAHG
jgi:hypothetical protein